MKLPRRFDLVPWVAVRAMSFIVAIGADKHGFETWKDTPWREHFDAAMSHLSYWIEGQRTDPDTGQSHLWNAITRIAFLIWQEMNGRIPPTA